ncbi:protein phosphatase CheZ [bacterium AH-315-J21]|nr:protein phosphatase CheZ [bacterium AH-315-J21]
MGNKKIDTINKDDQTSAPQVGSTLKGGLGALKKTIEELSESLREIQGPLADTRDTLPKATTHLDRISSQTEQAAHRVMDMVENISAQQVEIISHLNEAMNVLTDSGAGNKSVNALLEKAEEVANRSQNDAFAIMDALQFQDITTQQINHAASLLEEVDDKIALILGDLADDGKGSSSAKVSKGAPQRKKRSFDPHADMEFKHTDQTDIDNLVRQSNESKS